MKAKYFLLTVFILFLVFISSLVRARENWDLVPDVNSYISEAVQLTSFTNAVTAVGGVVVSSYHVTMHTVCITSAGVSTDVNPAALEIFDSNVTTGPSLNPRRIAAIDTTKVNSYTFDNYLSSGLSINNHGSVPGTVSIQYREK